MLRFRDLPTHLKIYFSESETNIRWAKGRREAHPKFSCERWNRPWRLWLDQYGTAA
jgi:hypothetical protein